MVVRITMISKHGFQSKNVLYSVLSSESIERIPSLCALRIQNEIWLRTNSKLVSSRQQNMILRLSIMQPQKRDEKLGSFAINWLWDSISTGLPSTTKNYYILCSNGCQIFFQTFLNLITAAVGWVKRHFTKKPRTCVAPGLVLCIMTRKFKWNRTLRWRSWGYPETGFKAFRS